MRKVLIALCAGMMLLAGVTAAKADEVLVIDKWDYAVDGIFTTWKDEDGRTGTVYNAGQANRPWHINSGYQLLPDKSGPSTNYTPRKDVNYNYLHGVRGDGSAAGYSSLRWGDNNTGYEGVYSSIGIEASNGRVITDPNYNEITQSLGVTLWHNNRPIASTTSVLYTGTVLLTLNLQPALEQAVLDALSPQDLAAVQAMTDTVFATTMDFFFYETPNDSATPSDIFIIKDPFEAATETFEVAGVEYTFSFGASFQPLTGAYLAAAQQWIGVSSDTVLYGWVTDEDSFTPIETYLTIHYRTPPPPYPNPTPEPGTILLMGAGLAGLGVIARRRRKNV